MLNKAKILKNYKLNSLDGEIGKVKDFYFDNQNWSIRYLIVNTGNWLTGRKVLISPKSIVSINKEEAYININLTKSQIENSPALDSDKPVSKQFQEEFNGYFQLPMYGTLSGDVGVGAALPYPAIINEKDQVLENAEDENEGDPNLHSAYTVNGYDIQAIDDKIGHVDDFIIDEETWEIRYMEMDTKNWLTGRKVLISPKWIKSVSWSESKVFVDLHSEEIKESPEYTEDSILDRDYETRLHQHYKRKAYWLNQPEVKDDSIK